MGSATSMRAKHYPYWIAGATILTPLPYIWASLVNKHVHMPYLDEVFHIRQAQKYCMGNFWEWDPKITTPPGLYLLSALISGLGGSCSTANLRSLNTVLLSFLFFTCSLHYLVHRDILPQFPNEKTASKKSSRETRFVIHSVHVCLNLALFPLLFFFSGLYYTDLGSSSFVLLQHWLQENRTLELYPYRRGVVLFFNGLAAVSFRQTNILWVAVFPAILDVTSLLKAYGNPNATETIDQPNAKDAIRMSWEHGSVYDPPFGSASLQDFMTTLISIVVASLQHITDILTHVWHYLLLMVTFVIFVIWNGSIVLGDKSNHVATIHLPQMLYIWPLITFFSFPLILSRLLATLGPAQSLPSSISRYRLNLQNRQSIILSVIGAITTLALMLMTIHYNTIIHPFTLADNRHYVFYVFRILRKHKSIKYLVAPIYLLCGYAVLSAFGSPSEQHLATAAANKKPTQTKASPENTKSSPHNEPKTLPIYPTPTSTSYVISWLATTTMTLVTAPLVEPRYFILPWIFWRLRVPGPQVAPFEKPAQTPSSSALKPPNPIATRLRYAIGFFDHGDYALYWETAWFMLINIVTGYIFLYWGFQWSQEPGNVQRFMW